MCPGCAILLISIIQNSKEEGTIHAHCRWKIMHTSGFILIVNIGFHKPQPVLGCDNYRRILHIPTHHHHRLRSHSQQVHPHKHRHFESNQVCMPALYDPMGTDYWVHLPKVLSNCVSIVGDFTEW